MTVSAKNDLKEAVERAGREQGFWQAPGLVVAVSGGGDSVALLSLLARYFPGRLVVAHLEHGIRGESSLRDASFVERLAADLGLPCHLRHVNTPQERARGESVEMAGRRLRYEFFAAVAEKESLRLVATGHTADDVVETSLFHIFRGTGLRGLAGIPPSGERAVRPIINLSRLQLRDYLEKNGIAWCEDETNDEDAYTRNKIRNQLLPWVRENLNPACDRALLSLAANAAAAESQAEREAEELLPWLSRPHPLALAAWQAELLRSLDDTKLVNLIRRQGRLLGLRTLDRERALELLALIRRGGRFRFQWSGDVEVCGAPLIGWVHRSLLQPPKELLLSAEGQYRFGRWLLRVERSEQRRRNGVWSRGVRLPLVVRSAAVAAQAEALSIPWWARPATPLLGDWVAGTNPAVQDESAYDMIASVLRITDRAGHAFLPEGES